MKYGILLFLLITSFFNACSQTSHKAVLAKDSVNIKAIPYACILLDRPSDFKVLSNNSILMSAGKETDLHIPASGSYNRVNAPKFLFRPDINFDFSAKVKPAFEKMYDGGAILVYSDAENFAKILFQYTGSKFILGMSVVKNKITDDSYFNISNSKEIYLRVTKTGKVFNFYSSTDGKEWNLTREFVYSKPETIKIGFYSQSPVGSNCNVEYSDIRYIGTKE